MQSWSRLVSRLAIRRKKRQSSVPDVLQLGGSNIAPPPAATTTTTTTTTTCSSTTDLSTGPYQSQLKQHQHQQKTKEEKDMKEPEQSQQPFPALPSTPSGQDVKVDVRTLEFPASKDLALTLGDEWSKEGGMTLPSLDHFLPPVAPVTDVSPVLRKKSMRKRLSLYRPKSTLLLRRSKSIPPIVS